MREQFGGVSSLFHHVSLWTSTSTNQAISLVQERFFFKKKNNLYFKKDRKDKEKTKQNTSGGLLTPAFAPPPWQSHASYSEAHCCAFLHDVCDDGLAYPFPDGILDVVLLVFVLSSIHPDR